MPKASGRKSSVGSKASTSSKKAPTKNELIALCEEKGIKGYKKMGPAEMKEAIAKAVSTPMKRVSAVMSDAAVSGLNAYTKMLEDIKKKNPKMSAAKQREAATEAYRKSKEEAKEGRKSAVAARGRSSTPPKKAAPAPVSKKSKSKEAVTPAAKTPKTGRASMATALDEDDAAPMSPVTPKKFDDIEKPQNKFFFPASVWFVIGITLIIAIAIGWYLAFVGDYKQILFELEKFVKQTSDFVTDASKQVWGLLSNGGDFKAPTVEKVVKKVAKKVPRGATAPPAP